MLFGERRDELAAMLAHPFAESDDLPRALDYARRAAANARRLFALREELGHRARIVELLDRLPEARPDETVDALVEWAWVSLRLAEYGGVAAALERAISIAREVGDKARLASSLSWMAHYQMVTGFPSRSEPYLNDAAALAAEEGNEQLLLLPLFFATYSIVDRDPAAAADQMLEVIASANRGDVIDILGHAMATRAIALARTGDFAAARTQIADALEVEARTVSPVKRADINISVGLAYHDMGMLEEGLEYTRKGAMLAEGANGLECACWGYSGVAQVQLDRQQYDDAIAEFNHSLNLSERAGFEGFVSLIHGGIAVAEFGNGHTAAAERLLKARDNARSLNDAYAAAVLSQQLADVCLRLGRHDEAEAAVKDAMDYYRAAGMRPYIARALDIEARLFDATGRPEEAARVREEAGMLRMPIPVPAAVPGQNPMVGA